MITAESSTRSLFSLHLFLFSLCSLGLFSNCRGNFSLWLCVDFLIMDLSLSTCLEIVAQLDCYLDRELSAREQKLVARHLETCHHCAQIFRFETDLLADIQLKLQRVEMPSALHERLMAALPAQPTAPK